MQGGILLKRLLAFGLDWYLSAIFLNLGSRGLAFSLGVGDSNGQVVRYTTTYLLLEMLLCLLVAFAYFVLVPHLSKRAQTPVMMLLRLEILTLNNECKPSLVTLAQRYLVTFFLLGYLSSQFSLFIFDWRMLLANYDTQYVANFLVVVSGVSLIVSAYLALKSKEFSGSLQDYLAKTKVCQL